MPDVKKMALAGVLALLSVFLFYVLGNVFIPITATSAQSMNASMVTSGFATQGGLVITIFSIVLYAIALAPLGIAVALFVDAVKT